MKFLRLAALPLLLVAHALGADTALDRYVKKADATYKYQVVRTTRGAGYTTYIIDLTSQTWRQPSEVDRTVWKHWMTLVKPDQVEGVTGFLFIGGGSIKAAAPAAASQTSVEIALTTHSVAAELSGVPNEPLRFADEAVTRNEDGIIAYTWMKYIHTGDETWPLRLPMTKAAVRAMDTITAVMAAPEGGGVKVEKFVVSGGSKRGWTTWTAAAVDPRVVAIVPASIDLLNLEKSFEHHFRVYGFFAPAVKDYVEAGFMDWAGTPEYRKLLAIEEPYSYRDRLTMPKFMIQGAGDQFFLPDSSRFYFDDLRGEKYLRYIPQYGSRAEGHGRATEQPGVLSGVPQRHAASAIHLDFRSRWRHPCSEQEPAHGGETVAGDQPGRARFPPGDYRAGVPRGGVAGSRRWRLPGTRAQAGEGLDGIFRGTDLSERRQVSFQVHHRGAREPGYGAVPSVSTKA